MKPNISVLHLINTAYSSEARQAFRSQSAQLAAFAAVAVIYAVRTSWQPKEVIDVGLRKELADVSSLLNIDRTAHQTFMIYVRRMMIKVCAHDMRSIEALDIICSPDLEAAHSNLLRYLGFKNIYTAGHMRTWAMKTGYEPLELKRK